MPEVHIIKRANSKINQFFLIVKEVQKKFIVKEVLYYAKKVIFPGHHLQTMHAFQNQTQHS